MQVLKKYHAFIRCKAYAVMGYPILQSPTCSALLVHCHSAGRHHQQTLSQTLFPGISSTLEPKISDKVFSRARSSAKLDANGDTEHPCRSRLEATKSDESCYHALTQPELQRSNF